MLKNKNYLILIKKNPTLCLKVYKQLLKIIKAKEIQA
jgi:hypothetical protein